MDDKTRVDLTITKKLILINKEKEIYQKNKLVNPNKAKKSLTEFKNLWKDLEILFAKVREISE